MNSKARSLALACLVLVASSGWSQGHRHPAASATDAGVAAQQAWGGPGKPAEARRTITITMGDDMRFRPARIEVGEGETVRFALRNQGKLPHEMVIGSGKELEAHAARMARQPPVHHEHGSAAHVAPGASGELVWKFNRPGSVSFACLVPGHFPAGMVGTIDVIAKAHPHR